MLAALLDRIRRQDDRRPGFPGEHWMALVAGVALLALAARRGRRGRGLPSAIAGAGLIARAATGRDGPLGRLRRATRPRDPVRDPPYL